MWFVLEVLYCERSQNNLENISGGITCVYVCSTDYSDNLEPFNCIGHCTYSAL